MTSASILVKQDNHKLNASVGKEIMKTKIIELNKINRKQKDNQITQQNK